MRGGTLTPVDEHYFTAQIVKIQTARAIVLVAVAGIPAAAAFMILAVGLVEFFANKGRFDGRLLAAPQYQTRPWIESD